jgi:hypothetical protein
VEREPGTAAPAKECGSRPHRGRSVPPGRDVAMSFSISRSATCLASPHGAPTRIEAEPALGDKWLVEHYAFAAIFPQDLGELSRMRDSMGLMQGAKGHLRVIWRMENVLAPARVRGFDSARTAIGTRTAGQLLPTLSPVLLVQMMKLGARQLVEEGGRRRRCSTWNLSSSTREFAVPTRACTATLRLGFRRARAPRDWEPGATARRHCRIPAGSALALALHYLGGVEPGQSQTEALLGSPSRDAARPPQTRKPGC